MKILISLLILFNLTVLADDGLIVINGGGYEAEAGLTAPGATSSFSVTLHNSNVDNNASALFLGFTSGDYDYLGGSYPGIGGSCSTSLNQGQACTLMLEHSPTVSGDSDGGFNLDYNLATTTLGSTHVGEFTVDGHSESLGVAGCSDLAPVISNVAPSLLSVSSSSTIYLSGYNFSVATNVNIPGLIVSSLNIIDKQNLSFVLATTAATANYNLEIQNECGTTVSTNAISVAPSTWTDLRTTAGVTAANPVYTTTGISGYTIDPAFGLRITNSNTAWSKMLRFDGMCDVPSKDFDIVIYRSGTSRSFMPSLWNASTAVNPFPGTTSYYRQYIGFWIPADTTSAVWGSQGGEGGSNWNQSFGAIALPAGKYYRFAFRGAAQTGQTVEVFEVDSSLNDISSLGSYVSNRPATPAISVCPGITPYATGVADYYVTAVRAL